MGLGLLRVWLGWDQVPGPYCDHYLLTVSHDEQAQGARMRGVPMTDEDQTPSRHWSRFPLRPMAEGARCAVARHVRDKSRNPHSNEILATLFTRLVRHSCTGLWRSLLEHAGLTPHFAQYGLINLAVFRHTIHFTLHSNRAGTTRSRLRGSVTSVHRPIGIT